MLNIVKTPDRFYERKMDYQDTKDRVCGTTIQAMAIMT